MKESYDDEQAQELLDELDGNISDIRIIIHRLNNLNTSQDIQNSYSNTIQYLYDYLRKEL